MTFPIVIPLSHCGGKLKDDTELRYALRSLATHFKDDFKIVIVGKHVPAWLTGAEHVYSGDGLKTALVDAARAYPDGFFWWYDDLTLLRDATGEELKITPAMKHWMAPKSGWSNSLEKIHKRLVEEGRPAFDYSRPHGPYWFDKSMVDEGFRDWPGMKSKFPWESWILSKRDWPRRYGVVKQYYGKFGSGPSPHSHLLNYNDKGNTPELRAWLAQRFPEASRFEKVVAASKSHARIEVHTLRYGDAWWIRNCSATLDAWAIKHGHPVKVWTDKDSKPEYPCPKFLEIDMLKAFLTGDADWLLYVDSDVWVNPDAPDHPTLSEGFHVMNDPTSKFSMVWGKWVARHFGKQETQGWDYKNAGVWMCDRASAKALLDVIAPPYVEGVMDQNQFNLWVCQAARKGMTVRSLSPDWNSFSGRMTKASFQHLAGQKKAEKWNRLKNAGLVWDLHPEKFRPAFDMSKYPVVDHDYMQMDDRHVSMLYDAACSDWSGPRVAVEIGSFKGRSTAALIEALNRGKLDHLHILEIKPTHELKQVLACALDHHKVTLHTKPSWECSIERADFVFIDGDHRWPALNDTLRALSWGAKVICMHDSNSWPTYEKCWGSYHAALSLKAHVNRTFTEDCEDRPNEKTIRGFFVSREVISPGQVDKPTLCHSSHLEYLGCP